MNFNEHSDVTYEQQAGWVGSRYSLDIQKETSVLVLSTYKSFYTNKPALFP